MKGCFQIIWTEIWFTNQKTLSHDDSSAPFKMMELWLDECDEVIISSDEIIFRETQCLICKLASWDDWGRVQAKYLKLEKYLK